MATWPTRLLQERLVIPWGQSNCLFLGREYFGSYNFGLAGNDLIAVGGAGIDYFAPGSTGFNEIKRLIIAQSIVWPLAPIWAFSIQGETDTQSLALANSWGTKWTAWADALQTQTGRSDLYFGITLLPSDLTAATYTYVAEVNASMLSCTRSGNRLHFIDLNTLAGANGGDHLHWDATRRLAWEDAMAAKVISVA